MTEPVPGLTKLQFRVLLGGLILLFCFINGPIWERVAEPDASILLSYVPIPVLTAACLLWNRNFTLGTWLLATFALTLFKYLATASIFLILLAWKGMPPRPERPPLPTGMRAAQSAPARAESAAAPAPATRIEIGPRGFEPALATIDAPGDVVFTSKDGRVHTVIATGEKRHVLFNKPIVGPTRLRFEAPGRVELHCAVHPEERGALDVRAPTAPR